MTDDASFGIVAVERLQELEEGGLLLGSASVGFASMGIYTALVTDAQRTAVVTSGVSATDSLGQNRNQVAVAANVPVVTGLTELGFACGSKVLDREVAVATG